MELLVKSNTTFYDINIPLVEKYRPNKLNDIILEDFMKLKIKNILKTKQIPNMIITGEPSTGKTSTIMYMIKKIYQDNYLENVIELNASDDRGLSMISNTIIPFCKKKTNGNKVIILDEADSITQKAQNLLNSLINDYKTTRFIFICNDRFKINEVIQSLCLILNFPKINKKMLKEKIKSICSNENIVYTKSGLNNLLFYSNYDIRQCINNLECVLYSDLELNDETIDKLFDIPKIEYIKKVIIKCNEKKLKEALDTITILYNNGYSPNDILLTFMRYILSSDFDIDMNEEIKLKLYKIISSSYIKINDGVNTILQLYGCISNIYELL